MKNKKYIRNVLVVSCISFVAVSFVAVDVFAAISAPSGTGLPTAYGRNPIATVIQDVIKLLVGIVGGLSVLMIVVGGIMYMSSGGDQGKVDTAKNIIVYSIVGLVVSLLAWIIVNVVIKTIS
ncbi:MAG: pilin [Candidatus Moraniibacteriota bacterium]|jgi:type IV secretion system pilin